MANSQTAAQRDGYRNTVAWIIIALAVGVLVPILWNVVDPEGLSLKLLGKGRLYVESALVTTDACGQYTTEEPGCLVVADEDSLDSDTVTVATLVNSPTLAALTARDDVVSEGVTVTGRRVGLPAGPALLASTVKGDKLFASAVEWAAGPGRASYRALLLVSEQSTRSDIEELERVVSTSLGTRWELSVVPTGEVGMPSEGKYDVLLLGTDFDTTVIPDETDIETTPVVTWTIDGWRELGLSPNATTAPHDIFDIERPGDFMVKGLYGPQAVPGEEDGFKIGVLVFLLAGALLFALVSNVAFTKEVDYRSRDIDVEALPSTLRFSYSYQHQRRGIWNVGIRWLNGYFAVSSILAVGLAIVIAIQARELGREPELGPLPDMAGGLSWVSLGLYIVVMASLWFSYLNLKPFRRVAVITEQDRVGSAESDLPSCLLQEEVDSDLGPGERDVGVCLSGGGIRAAAFGLGGIQALQDDPVWKRVGRLGAVSGGAYTAASYSLFQSRRPRPYQLDSDEMSRLRNNTHYLASGANGAFRAFTEWLTGFLWNVVLVAALLWSLAVVPALIVKSQAYLPQLWSIPDRADGPVPFISLTPGSSAAIYSYLIVAGLASIHMLLSRLSPMPLWRWSPPTSFSRLIPTEQEWKEGNRRMAQGFLFALLALIILLAVIPQALQIGGWIRDLFLSAPELASSIAGLASIGWVAAILRGLVAGRGAQIAQRLAGLVLPLLALAFFVWAAWLNVTFDWPGTTLGFVGAVLVIVLSWAQPARRVSLHTFYRNRLIDGFATDQDGSIDTDLSDLDSTPELDIGAVANIGPGPVTPPGRAALPWLFSGSATGLESDGSRKPSLVRTADLADLLASGRDGYRLTAMTAVAMSGAAFSPAMGRRTLKSFRALMAILNLRLGVWLPNPMFCSIWMEPGRVATDEFSRSPGQFPTLLKEALGIHRPDDSHLYITDGGHYDNLGLVNLLRRGFRTVVCLDASADGARGFTTIADAMMLARAELGVDIDLDPERDGLWPVDEESEYPESRYAVVTATMTFEDGGTGHLIYCRASLTGSTPWSIDSYRRRDPGFPNTSTLRQLFGDETFEAYRSLGFVVGTTAASACQELQPVDV